MPLVPYIPQGRAHSLGGRLADTHGGRFSNGVTFVNEGGSHEANPNGGVRYGVDGQGVPNLVEQGELVSEVDGTPVVWSDRLRLPRDLVEGAGLPLGLVGRTVADAAKRMQRESEERPLDEISLRGLKANFRRLYALQETMRQEMGLEGTQQVQVGGPQGLPQTEQAPQVQGMPEPVMQGQEAAQEGMMPDVGYRTGNSAACGGRIFSGNNDTMANNKANKEETLRRIIDSYLADYNRISAQDYVTGEEIDNNIGNFLNFATDRRNSGGDYRSWRTNYYDPALRDSMSGYSGNARSQSAKRLLNSLYKSGYTLDDLLDAYGTHLGGDIPEAAIVAESPAIDGGELPPAVVTAPGGQGGGYAPAPAPEPEPVPRTELPDIGGIAPGLQGYYDAGLAGALDPGLSLDLGDYAFGQRQYNDVANKRQRRIYNRRMDRRDELGQWYAPDSNRMARYDERTARRLARAGDRYGYAPAVPERVAPQARQTAPQVDISGIDEATRQAIIADYLASQQMAFGGALKKKV